MVNTYHCTVDVYHCTVDVYHCTVDVYHCTVRASIGLPLQTIPSVHSIGNHYAKCVTFVCSLKEGLTHGAMQSQVR